MENESQYIQCMVMEIAHQLGFREMGISRYNGEHESAESRSGRLDGIIAGMNHGDIVICQFPTGNGMKFDSDLIKRIKAYKGRIAIFIYDIKGIIQEDRYIRREVAALYNQAEVLIVPSLAMQQLLQENGIKKGMKFVVHEMWDCTTEKCTSNIPEYKKEIHFTDCKGLEGIKEWKHETVLKIYDDSIDTKGLRNVLNMGKKAPEELTAELAKGGFGLVWHQDGYDRRNLEYSAALSTSRYISAGIPVIVPRGILSQRAIEENHLGFAVDSLEEADLAIGRMERAEYQEYLWSVEQFAPVLKGGYYTKKCLIDTMQAFYTKGADRLSIPSRVNDLDDYRFAAVAMNASYGGNFGLSWTFEGQPDGFLIYDVSGKLVGDIRNISQHYFLVKGYRSGGFIIKAYLETWKGKLVVAASDSVSPKTRRYAMPKVSLIIPAYNAEDYIYRSIDTALAQSFSDLEIIVVDDGSTDRTPEIIDWYAEQYTNIVAVHQKNKGPSGARNSGIIRANGDYICFLDSDDMLLPDMVAGLYDSIKKTDCDIAITSAYQINQDGHEIFVRYDIEDDTEMDIQDFFKEYYIKECGYGVVVWNKLYRASLVKAHLFPGLTVEDEAWTPYILSYADRICYIDGRFYEYDRTIRDFTLVDKAQSKTREEQFKNYRDSVMFYIEHGNTKRIGMLKKLAHKRLTEKAKVFAYAEYGELWNQIEKIKYNLN